VSLCSLLTFVLEMDRTARRAKRTLAVLSPDYLHALYTQPEWAAAFAQDPTGERGSLLPVRSRQVAASAPPAIGSRSAQVSLSADAATGPQPTLLARESRTAPPASKSGCLSLRSLRLA
jgi:hypothetical protein